MSTEDARDSTRTGIEIDALSLGGALGVVSALVMVLLGLLGSFGQYEEGVGMMETWHVFFEPTLVGTVAGAVEAFLAVFVFTYLSVSLYNRLLDYRQ